ncbi:hypothetical protein NBRC116188_05630 [Oceaniserpentilla sp. 4NH20-0058]|uniref:Gfo/Idh/MocA family oxidoreductase n=1 Tax=Oceaniserpentilla sp. 4NH20-0058 TaxID=3127660 RepID=UPI00310BEC99
MANILIVGAGQLGSRHLQSLASLDKQNNIFVVDPSQDALEVAKSRYSQVSSVESPVDVIYQSGYEGIPYKIDVCIVATNAAHRFTVIKEITKWFEFRFLVLEKVLFQNTEELYLAQQLLKENNIPTWVNCPRRMFSVYQSLKTRVEGSHQLKFRVEGAEWGLACNSIHFIDLWAFLVAQSDYRIDLAELDEKIFPSKRPGYSEVYGTISGGIENFTFSLTCDLLQEGGSAIPLVITIETDEAIMELNEAEQQFKILDLDGNQVEVIDFKVRFQSEMSSEVVEMLLKKGDCNLTPFNESLQLHSPFLNAMLEFFNKHSDSALSKCPIT